MYTVHVFIRVGATGYMCNELINYFGKSCQYEHALAQWLILLLHITGCVFCCCVLFALFVFDVYVTYFVCMNQSKFSISYVLASWSMSWWPNYSKPPLFAKLVMYMQLYFHKWMHQV